MITAAALRRQAESFPRRLSMALITLICPHCGGDFELDPERNLQPYWVCPYCGNRSLMQKNDNAVRLRGIISGKTSLTSYTPQAAAEQEGSASSPSPPPNPTEIPAGTAFPAPYPQPAPVISSAQPVDTRRTLAEIIAEAVAEPVQPEQAAGSMAASEQPVAASFQGQGYAQTQVQAHAQAPAQAQTQAQTKAAGRAPVAEEPAVRPVQLADSAAGRTAKPDPDFERLCHLAEDAAQKHDLPLFNSYSRQAIDIQPTDPRMYAWRAILIEEAGGFALATWTAPFWIQQAPSRKVALIANHFYSLSTALKFGSESRQNELLRRIAALLVQQLVDHVHEQAVLRCRQNLIFRTFKGRYHKDDLRAAVPFADAVRHVEAKAFPIGMVELMVAMRIEIEHLPRRIARRLKRI
jgi:hypothetical protein